jgi:esterase
MELFYRKYGKGPVVIILHGLFGSSDNWNSVAKKLEDKCTVILPDLRNHGKSPHSDTHDYESMSNDVFELAEKISPGKFFLAGHSMGGKTAMRVAIKWPWMINGLVVADISPFRTGSADSEYKIHRSILETMLSLDLSQVSTREQAEKMLGEKGFDERITAFILKNLHRKGSVFEWRINAPSLMKNLDEIISPLDRSRADSFRVTGFPVLFLKGERSGYLPESDYPDILKIFPAAEFKKISNAGHWLHADNQDEVVSNLREFIS